MKLAKWTLACGAAMALASCVGATASGVENAAPALQEVRLLPAPEVDPAELEVLFWDEPTRTQRFREMEKWFAGHEVPAAQTTRTLVKGDPLPAAIVSDINAMMAKTNAAGVMVWHKGKVRFEAYGLDFDPEQRWTSFSVAKSFTSTLLGAAIADGFIGGLEDPVTQYIPELEGSAYDGVTVKQLATMTSGVAWNENYTDPNSDVAKMGQFVLEYEENAIVEQMKRLGREADPGEVFNYKTGETNLIGLLVENAVGLSLAEYAQEKIVEPAGFEKGLFWMTDARGGNIGGCCLSLTLGDYTRMGVFVLEGGKSADGAMSVPEGWFAEAGDSVFDFSQKGYGYGYQWWTYPGGDFGAQGIFGQSITLKPSEDLVLTVVSNWPVVTSGGYRLEWGEIANAIAASES